MRVLFVEAGQPGPRKQTDEFVLFFFRKKTKRQHRCVVWEEHRFAAIIMGRLRFPEASETARGQMPLSPSLGKEEGTSR